MNLRYCCILFSVLKFLIILYGAI
uniref:Uncharacterized protein n=1 Tax=Arundo donax TaxID=35708 RepID=A0A0A9AXJ4_ARUDO